MPYTTSVAGSVITASWANTNVRDQVVTPFASSAARTSSITAPVEGMLTVLTDSERVDIYNGSSWSALVAPAYGALTSWTPAVVQSGSVASTNSRSVYQRVGRVIHAWFYVTMTGTGTADNVITVSLPVTAASTAGAVRFGQLRDNSAASNATFVAKLASTTTVQLATTAVSNSTTGDPDADAYLGLSGSGFAAALTTDDWIMGHLCFDAAADA